MGDTTYVNLVEIGSLVSKLQVAEKNANCPFEHTGFMHPTLLKRLACKTNSTLVLPAQAFMVS